ncbi:MAG TPA: ATP-binding protein [Opitutaceae bacterium]|nr:ATP-binding protein [Opitutaceae bacterium]
MSQNLKSIAPSPSAQASPAEAVAILTLDAAGRITLASAMARQLWQAGETELVGEAFPNLFFFEVTSREPDWLEAQWEVLLAAALEKSVALTAQPHESAHREVTVRLEKISGGTPAYLAHVMPADAPAPASAAALPTELAGLAVLAERSSLGFFDLNFKDSQIYYSVGWKKILGFTEQELANTYDTWLKLLHPDDSAAAPDQIAKRTSPAARAFSLEFRMQHRRGHYLWIQSCGVQIFGAGGVLERVTGLHIDITERKEQEEIALASEDRLQGLASNGPLGVFDLDFAQNRYWLSPAWQQLLGYARDEITDAAETFRATLPAAEAVNGLAAFFVARHPGETTYLEPGLLRHKNGSFISVLLGASRQYSNKGELQRVIGFHLARPAEAQAAASAPAPAAGDTSLASALVTDALSALTEGVIVTNAEGGIISLNAKAAQLIGCSAEGVVGQAVGKVFQLVRRDLSTADDAFDRVMAATEPLGLSAEHALVTAAGAEPLSIVWIARQSFDAAGHLQGFIFVFRNPDELTLSPDELIKTNRFESLGLLASGIAHDFNNLLTTILGGVSLAKDTRDYSALGDSEKACLAAKSLTKQLLLFAKGGTNAKNVVAPADILNEAARIASAGSSVLISIDAPPDAAPVLVSRSQILQVFQNLVVNAVQAMKDAAGGKIQLRAVNVALADDQVPPLPGGNYVQFEVRDNGSGIAPENLQKIFDPFFTTKKHGTGLGLSTVLSIVQQHGGQIGVDSTVGEGTVFTVFLPPAATAPEVEARAAPTLRFGTGRVLFMDDDLKICELTGNMLTSLDYKFDIAHNGEEATTFYRRYLNIGRPYDAVILDLTVIGGTGGEATFKQLRELDPDVRAIVASGYDNDEMAKRFLDMGFCGYLTKPYRVTDLGKVLKTVLG